MRTVTFAWPGGRRPVGALRAALTVATLTIATVVGAAPAGGAVRAGGAPFTCPPAATALSFDDSLDKATADGVPVTELSALAPDLRTLGFVSVSDNDARLFFISNPFSPRVTRTVQLARPDGTPYDGDTLDGEGVAVQPDGRILVSSELEPSIRVFGRTGVEQSAPLPVPARFRVAPAGEAVENGTLESLSISPSGRHVYAAMEAPLSGDASSTIRRMLVYRADSGGYVLDRQLGYQADPGHRISEIAAYADGRLLILEVQFTVGVGNDIKLYAVTNADRATDVSGIANLSTAPAGTLVAKRLIANLTACPTLGATAPQPQINPLLDNYEGLAAIAPFGRGPALVHLISDDNGDSAQVTRLLTLAADLP